MLGSRNKRRKCLAGPDKSEGVTSTFAELKIVADDDEINPAIDNLSIGRTTATTFQHQACSAKQNGSCERHRDDNNKELEAMVDVIPESNIARGHHIMSLCLYN